MPGQAAKLGLVDGVVAKEQLLAAACEWAAAIAAGTKPRNFSLYRSAAHGTVFIVSVCICAISSTRQCSLACQNEPYYPSCMAIKG